MEKYGLRLLALATSVCLIGRWNQALQTTRIPYTDVGHRAQIVGRFDQPIGDYLVLEGIRIGSAQHPSKLGFDNFKVEKINGKPLGTPVKIWVDELTPKPAGTRCTAEGYETGEMIGVPDQVLDRTGRPGPQAPWQFAVRFVVLSARQTK